jgi:hypothetical protein
MGQEHGEGNQELTSQFLTLPLHRPSSRIGRERKRQPLGFSMLAATSPPNIPIGMREVDKYYRESMLSTLMNTITQALGTPIKFPEGYKPSLKSDGL